MFFTYKDKNIHYQKKGKGNCTLVLIHGFPEDGSIFHKQVLALEKTFQIIVPDLPGVGLSPYNNQLQSIEDFAKAIVALLQYEKVENCLLLGHSMGGYIALAIEELFPKMSIAFGFIHSSAYADTEEKKENRRKSISFIQKNGSAPFVKKAIPGNFAPTFVKENTEIIDELIQKASNFSPEALQRFYEIMIARPDRTHVLQSTQKPVLFIIGDEDKAAPLQDLLPQVTMPAIADVHIISGIAHMSMLESSEVLNQYIKDFAVTCNAFIL